MTTDDKQLLELAAKACGYTLVENCDMHGEYWPWCNELEDNWCPLTDDGDALRLAVKLNMTLRIYYGNACAQIGVPGMKNAYADEVNYQDTYAATRRAIVRAASEIGKAMP